MKTQILDALESFVKQRPGFELRNYASMANYRADQRPVEKQRKAALEMIQWMRWHDSLTAADLVFATQRAFSGRLKINIVGDQVTIDYCTGQYFPTEFRKAVCIVLKSAIWKYLREDGDTAATIYKKAKREFSSKCVTDLFKD